MIQVKEETVRQKIRAIWMHAGDNNSKTIHNFASTRRRNNSVWELSNSNGEIITGDKGLKGMVVDHFTRIYSNVTHPNLLGQLKVIKLFP